MLPDQTRIERTSAIDMTVYSGNLLFRQRDARHYWALTVIISHLFELVGEGESGADRFVDRYVKITGHRHDLEVALGWHAGCIARSIRNLVGHGMEASRTQMKNYETRERVQVRGLSFYQATTVDGGIVVYNVNRIDIGIYSLSFAPSMFWRYVQKWYGYRSSA